MTYKIYSPVNFYPLPPHQVLVSGKEAPHKGRILQNLYSIPNTNSVTTQFTSSLTNQISSKGNMVAQAVSCYPRMIHIETIELSCPYKLNFFRRFVSD